MLGKMIGRDSTRFPPRLTAVTPRIEQLWYRGRWSSGLFRKTVAVVGSRKMTRYGKTVLAEIVPRLVAAGYTTVSGYMYGIDVEMHRLTIEAGGRTIAVLGYGIDSNLDIENGRLYDKFIKSNSLFLSEYPAKTPARTWTFPQRNRIVVGLAELLIVVEAAQKSGSLNSASWAERIGREVWAVPGPMYAASSAGANTLIAQGKAHALTPAALDRITGTTAEQIYPAGGRIQRTKLQVSQFASKILEQLRLSGPASSNDLARATGSGSGPVSAALTELSILGRVGEENGLWRRL